MKKDLKKDGAGSGLSGKLRLQTKILTQVDIPIAGIGYLMPKLEVMPFPYQIKESLKGSGYTSTRSGNITIVKLTIPNLYQWEQSVKATSAEFVVYQPSVGVSAGWTVVEDKENPVFKWISNILSAGSGIATLDKINISGPITFYSYDPIKRELYGERIIKQKEQTGDRFNGYQIESVFGAYILSWKFPSKPESDVLYAFVGSPVPVHEIPKYWLDRAISRFGKLDTLNDAFTYIDTTIEMGDNNEINK